MVMTYDGALVMPSSYAMMEQEEMTYVEGGDRVYYDTLKNAKNYFAFVMGAAASFGGASSQIAYVGGIGTFYYGMLFASAVNCFNQCKTWLNSYKESQRTKVTEHTISGVISGYSVALA